MSGTTDVVKGRVKEAVGALTNDDKLRKAGKSDKVAGRVKQAEAASFSLVSLLRSKAMNVRICASGALTVLLILCLVGLSWYAADSRAERPKVVNVAPPPAQPVIVIPPPAVESVAQIEPAPEPVATEAPLLVAEPLVVVDAPPTVAVAVVVAEDPNTMSGTIVGVGELRRISLLINGQGHVFTVDPTATITLNGDPALLTDLAVGMNARVRWLEGNPDQAVEVAAVYRRGCGVTLNPRPIAYMGVRLDASDSGPGGVKILDVFENSPADRVDFYLGDRIVSIDDVSMQNSKQILATIRAHRPNDRLQVEILRDGESRVIPVVLAERKPRVETFDECECGCAARIRDYLRTAPASPNGQFTDRQQELIAQNQQLKAMLQQLQKDVRVMRAELATSPRP